MNSSIRAAVVGASGYTGAQLAELLLGHPHANIVGLFGTGRTDESTCSQPTDAPAASLTSRPMSELHARLLRVLDMPIEPFSIQSLDACKPDVIFLCTPHQASASIAHAIVHTNPHNPHNPHNQPHASHDSDSRGGTRDTRVVIDLSAAYRLPDASLYPRWYDFEHPHPALLTRAVYGLPEHNHDQIARAELIAAPGCYPTSVLLPIMPLVGAGAIVPGTRPIADCISGVSGAGRTPTLGNTLCEVSAHPYAVFAHRHSPEITTHAGVEVVFTPHLGPYPRGIVSTIHVQLTARWSESKVRELLETTYAKAPFVRLLPAGCWPSVAGVCHTNFCDIGLAVDEQHHHLILCSSIDNLLKGAAGQALQCMNIRFGLDQTLGFGWATNLANPTNDEHAHALAEENLPEQNL